MFKSVLRASTRVACPVHLTVCARYDAEIFYGQINNDDDDDDKFQHN